MMGTNASNVFLFNSVLQNILPLVTLVEHNSMARALLAKLPCMDKMTTWISSTSSGPMSFLNTFLFDMIAVIIIESI